ncbi:DUF4936 family protein [Undibacterium sp. Ji49W]
MKHARPETIKTADMDCYIYFKTMSSQETEVILQEQLLQDHMRQQSGNAHGLQRRPSAQDGLHTWMEVHRQVSPDFEQQLAQAYAQTRLSELLQGERHMEYFMDVSLCA